MGAAQHRRFGFEEIEIGNNATEVVESIIDGISAFRDELITPEELEAYLQRKGGEQLEADERVYLNQLNDLLKVYKAYAVYKRKERLLDFDDMIHEASALFDRKPTLVAAVPRSLHPRPCRRVSGHELRAALSHQSARWR